MKLEIIQKLDNYFLENPTFRGIPVKKNDIDLAEKELKINFNEDYINFISRYGGASIGIDIYSTISSHNSSIIGIENVIEKTKSIWKEYLEFNTTISSLYVISDDGTGNPILMHKNGKIYIFYHDNFSIELLYSDLEDLLEDFL